MEKFELIQVVKFAKGHYNKNVSEKNCNYLEILQKCIGADGYPHIKSNKNMSQLILSRVSKFEGITNKESFTMDLIRDIHPDRFNILDSLNPNRLKLSFDESIIEFCLSKLRFMSIDKLGYTHEEFDSIPSLELPTYFDNYEEI